MKKGIIIQTWIIYIILFSSVLFSIGCKKSFDNTLSDNTTVLPADTTLTEDTPPDEIVVWRKPGKSYQEYVNWLQGVAKTYGEVNQHNPCGSCDSSLMVLKGRGIKLYISTGGTVSGSVTSGNSPGPVGEDGPMWVSRNYRVNLGHPVSSSNLFLPASVGTYSGTKVKVAVFDTGDPKDLKDFTYTSSGSSCITGAELGWNFINQTANYNDDNDIKHGTIVTRFITNQAVKFRGNQVEILPVKTHNRNGVSDLARILCAFAYAKERGANIINASFGYYATRRAVIDSLDPSSRLLKEFVKHYLTSNQILLVAAAGNKDDVNEKAAFDLDSVPYPNDPRNLENMIFLPCSLAELRSFPNVIAVTTVHKSSKNVSPNQNYSRNTVDIGVNADAVLGDHYVFNHPLLDSTQTVEGSSFATSILTGILSANYDRYKQVLKNGNFTKEDIWNKLDPIVSSDSSLRSKIKDGRYVRN